MAPDRNLMPAPSHSSEADPEIGRLAEELTREYGHTVPRDVIEATLRECFGQWTDARIRDFIPVLAARCAHNRLGRRDHRRTS